MTIGQTPRDDILPDLLSFVDRPLKRFEFGVLDNMDDDDWDNLQPAKDEMRFSCRLRDGSYVMVSADAVEQRVADLCSRLDHQDFDLIVVFSTMLYLDFNTRTPLLHTQRVVDAWIETLILSENRIGVIYLLEEQHDRFGKRFVGLSRNLQSCTLTGQYNNIECIADKLHDCDIVLLNSVSYTEQVAKRISKMIGKPVVTADRVLAANLRSHLDTLYGRRYKPYRRVSDRLKIFTPKLTAREVEVLVLVVQGKSSREIASALSVSRRTVEKHRENAMGKMSISKVTDLIRITHIL